MAVSPWPLTGWDGRAATCSNKKNSASRNKYTPKSRPSKGRRFVAVRNNDQKQARRRVNYLVEQKLIPHPNDIPCVDCGHVYKDGERRHEYDHYLGYEGANHEDVESVCTTCHKKRTNNG